MDLNIKTNLFNKTRQRSIKIIENLSPEDMNIQSMEDASPIKWHLAHTTWFFETGGSFTELTVNVHFPTLLIIPRASPTSKVKESGP